MEEIKQKILLIKLSSLGDVIFCVPLANALKNGGFEVHWLVGEKGFDIVNNNPCVEKTILVPIQKWRKDRFNIENLKEAWGILKQIRAEKYDIAIDAQMMFKSFLWMLFCGAKRRITSKKAKELTALCGTEWVENISYKPDCPIVLNYLKYAQHLGIPLDKAGVSLPKRSDAQIAKVDELLKDLDPKKPTVVIAPATTWDYKHWSVNNWKKVAANLSQDCNLVFTNGTSKCELIDEIRNGKGFNLAGKTDVLELLELFSRADVVISPDSGSANLAWLTGKPAVVTIFTCTPKEILAPLGNSNKYIALGGEGLPCQPCFKRKCKLKKNKGACINFPNPKDVIDVVHTLIF